MFFVTSLEDLKDPRARGNVRYAEVHDGGCICVVRRRGVEVTAFVCAAKGFAEGDMGQPLAPRELPTDTLEAVFFALSPKEDHPELPIV